MVDSTARLIDGTLRSSHSRSTRNASNRKTLPQVRTDELWADTSPLSIIATLYDTVRRRLSEPDAMLEASIASAYLGHRHEPSRNRIGFGGRGEFPIRFGSNSRRGQACE
jgi:hypothetical protein